MAQIDYEKIIDVSLPITQGMITYPNNPEVEIEIMSTGHSQVSKVILGTHTGTHVDFPKHVFNTGTSLEDIPTEVFVGNCRVLDITQADEKVTKADLVKERLKVGERILLKTKNSQKGYEKFYNDYVYLDGDAAKYLAELSTKLVGIDYLSVKKRGSKDNTPHTHLLEKNIPIFEGLDLSKTEPGEYLFLGVPLKFTGLDGAPCRVLLLK